MCEWIFWNKSKHDERPDMDRVKILQYYDTKTKSWVDYKRREDGTFYVNPGYWYWDSWKPSKNIQRRWCYSLPLEEMCNGDTAEVKIRVTVKNVNYSAAGIQVQLPDFAGTCFVIPRENVISYENSHVSAIKNKIAELTKQQDTLSKQIEELQNQLTSI